jgi:PKD repeat protein
MAPALIRFYNNSQNATRYRWDFGDGTSSERQSPEHIYRNPGTYTVTLTAFGAGNQSSTATQSITIEEDYNQCFIKVVTIRDFPEEDNGSDWDSFAQGWYPDVYFTIWDATNQGLAWSLPFDMRKENLEQSDLPESWTFPDGIEIPKELWENEYEIDLWDYDSTSDDDYIGTASSFTLEELTTGANAHPEKIFISSGGVSIEIELEWEK